MTRAAHDRDRGPTADHLRPARSRPARSRLAVAAALLVVVAACSWGSDDDEPDEPLPQADAPDLGAVREGSYDWSRVPLGAGGFVTGMVAAVDGDDPVLYARTDVGGAYRWDGEDERWVQMLLTGTVEDGEIESGDYSVASIAVAASEPDTVALMVGSDYNPGGGEDLSRTGRVLVSRDGGATWTASEQRWFESGNQTFRTGSERLAIDPTDPDRLLVGTQREGLWASPDGGVTWDEVPADDVPHGVDDQPEADQAGVSLVTYLPDGGEGPSTALVGVAHSGLFRSDDPTAGWEEVLALETGERPASATPAGDDIVLSIDTPGRPDARLLRVTDGRETTEIEAPAEADGWKVAADPHDPDRLVLTDQAVRDGHLWSSSDGGDSWQDHDVEIEASKIPWLAQTDLESYMTAGQLLFDPATEGRVWFAEGMGVWRTDDLDADTITWASEAVGIEELVVSSIVDPPGDALFVTTADRQGFRLTSLDQYPNATLVDDGFASGTSIDFSAGDPDRMAWVGAQSNLRPDQAAPRGATSSDGGETWEEMGAMVPEMYGGEVAVSTTDPDRIVWLPSHSQHPYHFLDDPVGLYTSGDGGESWEHVSPDGTVDSFHRFFWWFGRRALAADGADGRFYLMSDERRFYASDDGGLTWTEADHAPPCNDAQGCQVFGQVQAVPGQAGHLWASTGSAGLHRTDDAGSSEWQAIEGLAEARAFALGAPVGDSDEPAVYVVGRAPDEPEGTLGLWRSIDAGATWELISRYPARLAAEVTTLGADPDVPGRVYVGFGGLGAVVGDDPAL